jgi:nitric oxide reductase subunit C
MPAEKKKIITISLLCIAFFFYTFCLYLLPPVQVKEVSDDTRYGKLVWQQYNCNACHQVYGLGGFLGPDLTNTYSTRGPAYIKAFLQIGTATMPDFHLNDQELKSLVAYLQNIDASGKADPRTFRINTNGTIEQ